MDGIKSLEKIKEAIWFLRKIDENKYWDMVNLIVDLQKEVDEIIENTEEKYNNKHGYDYGSLESYVDDLEAAIENCIDIMRNR